MAYLVAGAWTEFFEEAFGRRITRQLDLSVEDRAFTAFLLKSHLEDEVLCPVGLLEFTEQLNLRASEHSKLIATIFRLVGQTFGLARDPVLKGDFARLMATDGIGTGKMTVHRVGGIETAICEASPRLKLSHGSLVVCFTDRLAVSEIKAVEAPIGRRQDAVLAVVDFTSPSLREGGLLISPSGIAVVDIEVRLSRDIEAFSDAYARRLPEAPNLLAIWNADARTALAVVGRSEPALTTVAVPCFGFRFEITHVFSMGHGLFVSGWFTDPDRLLKEIWVVDYGLVDQGLFGRWVVAPAKVSMDGEVIAVRQFHAFVERRNGYAAPANMAFALELRNGERHPLYRPGCQNDAPAARDGILHSINQAGFGLNTLTRVFLPAVNPLQTALNNAQRVNEVLDLGTRSTRDISILIPLCRELKFIRAQLIAFDADPFLRANCQIIYVVDDPLIAHQARQILMGAAHVFALDIRLVLLERRGGHAQANNLGAREANGRTLVLMNSNVVPDALGWLAPMTERLATLPTSSVIGPKLIHADGSLQHAGISFHRLPNGQWEDMHVFKGYGRDFPPANMECEVPAVAGALMVLRSNDYLEVGGFSTEFVSGDYADSDLCLKLRAQGGRCLYMPSATLFHFERPPMPDQHIDSTIYDRALHSLRWPEMTEASTAETRYAG